MKILALETATEACSAALLVDDTMLERFEVLPQGHSQLLLPMIEELLAEAAIPLGAVDALAFGRGPGAFTGVRIAVAVAQGIAFGADLPVVPVSTLAALAQGSDRDQVLTAIDARMGEVYWGAYRRDQQGIMMPMMAERVSIPDQVPVPDGAGWTGLGSGWATHAGALMQRLGNQLLDYQGDALPHAGAVARLGRAGFELGQAVTAEQALPVYLRDDVAWQKSAPSLS